MSDYNGYTNYATWNVCLWVDNEYALYTEKVDSLRDLYKWSNKTEVTPAWAEGLYSTLLGEYTPDLTNNVGEHWADVDWGQIADELTTELRELIAYDKG